MSWTYGHPGASPMDSVRYLIGDVKKHDPLQENEELEWALTQCSGNIYLAGAMACGSIAAGFARDADKSVDDIREQLSQRARAFAARGLELREMATQGLTGVVGVAPFVGGLSVARAEAAAADPDLIHSAFRPGQFDA